MNTHVKKNAIAPWYSIGMVWLMIGLPAIVVIASLFTLVIAHQNAPTVLNAKVHTTDSQTPEN